MSDVEIQATRSITITSNGASEHIDLYPGLNKVNIFYQSATGNLTPQHCIDEGQETAFVLADGTAVITNSVPFDVTGPGKLNFSCTSVTGTIHVKVNRAY